MKEAGCEDDKDKAKGTNVGNEEILEGKEHVDDGNCGAPGDQAQSSDDEIEFFPISFIESTVKQAPKQTESSSGTKKSYSASASSVVINAAAKLNANKNKRKPLKRLTKSQNKRQFKTKYRQLFLPQIECITLGSSSDEEKEEGENDDVIIVPQKIPVVEVEDSSDESGPESPKVHSVIEKSSTGTDDFIRPSDVSRLMETDVCSFNETPIAADPPVVISVENLTPKRPCPSGGDTAYRVERSDFRALDVYESESDVSVYSKGSSARRPTIITNLDTTDSDESMEEVDKTIHQRKRNSSVLGKQIPEVEHIAGTPTPVSYIAKGEAIEIRGSKRARRDTGNASGGASDKMSDTEFIATIKHLSGCNEETHESDSDSEIEFIFPTAREIAEQTIQKAQTNKTIEKVKPKESTPLVENNTTSNLKSELIERDAAPDTIQKLKDVFNSIDQITRKKKEQSPEMTDLSVLLKSSPKQKDYRKAWRSIKGPKAPLYNIVTSTTFKSLFGRTNSYAADEMHRFYSWSWGNANFDVMKTLNSMNPTQKLWKIDNVDRMPRPRRAIKCFNCLTIGHMSGQCPMKKRDKICYMCGVHGHLGRKCPNAVCLRCGQKSDGFTRKCRNCRHFDNIYCAICTLKGHSLKDCPDKWRRYYSTTQRSVPLTVVDNLYKTTKYCCHCGKRGHLVDSCFLAARNPEYPNTSTRIQSNFSLKEYCVPPYQFEEEGIPFNMLSNPKYLYAFRFKSPPPPNSFFDRFLKAVRLERPSPTNEEIVLIEPEDSNSLLNKRPQISDEYLRSEYVPEPQIEAFKEATENESDNVSNNGDKRDESSPTVFKTPNTHEKEAPIYFDSDSNYSFSEHFEVPSEKSINLSQSSTSKITQRDSNVNTQKGNDNYALSKSLPDYIPLSDSNNSNFPAFRPDLVHDEVSFAKIMIAPTDNSYLMSPEGHSFLEEISKRYDIKTRMDWTPIGNEVHLYGKKSNQQLLRKALTEEFARQDRQNIKDKQINLPRRAEPLVLFIRKGLLELFSFLGNPRILLNRLDSTGRNNSKTAIKLKTKLRRSLNMILFGQAGLCNGSQHVGKLISQLFYLTQNLTCEDIVEENLRTEILEHWNKIFSSQHHDNYKELVYAYISLPTKNHLKTLGVHSQISQCMTDLKRPKPKIVSCLSAPSLQSAPNIEITSNANSVATLNADNEDNDNMEKPISQALSKEAAQVIDKCFELPDQPPKLIKARLMEFRKKIRDGILTHKDHQSLLFIFKYISTADDGN